MTLYEQLQALVAASAGGMDLGVPQVMDGMWSPSMLEAEMAVSVADRVEALLATADGEELRAARSMADGDPMLRDAIDAELGRRQA